MRCHLLVLLPLLPLSQMTTCFVRITPSKNPCGFGNELWFLRSKKLDAITCKLSWKETISVEYNLQQATTHMCRHSYRVQDRSADGRSVISVSLIGNQQPNKNVIRIRMSTKMNFQTRLMLALGYLINLISLSNLMMMILKKNYDATFWQPKNIE